VQTFQSLSFPEPLTPLSVRPVKSNVKIAVVGSGYVGPVAAVCFAEISHEVVCVDSGERRQ
jgi:UDP-N-acetyl-D-mannosaminuronate dehydrogenase